MQVLAPADELEPVGQAVQDVAELPAAEYVPAPQSTHVADEPKPETIFPAAAQPHVADEPELKTDRPAAVQLHDNVTPEPVHEKPVLAAQVSAPAKELEPVGQAMQNVAELLAAEYVPAPQLTHVADEPEPETIFPAAAQPHVADEPEPKTDRPAAVQLHDKVAPKPVHEKPVLAAHALAPAKELEPVGQAMQNVAELLAAEYVPALQSTHVADEPKPETIFPAAAQPHDKVVPEPVHEKPVLAAQVPAPAKELEPVGHCVQDVAEFPAAEYVPVPQSTHVADEPEPETIFPAAVQPHDKVAPEPVHEKPVLAAQVPAPADEPEPDGHAVHERELAVVAANANVFGAQLVQLTTALFVTDCE